MSEKIEIELPIFKPLQEYFKFLYGICETFDVDCIDKELLRIITNDCDTNGDVNNSNDVSENFKNAVDMFALNLKTYDYPISNITIKGTLFNIFKESFENFSSKTEIINNIDTKINNNEICKNVDFKLDNKYDDEKTYKEELDEIMKSSDDLGNYKQIFNKWLEATFQIYGESKKAFNNFIENIKNEMTDNLPNNYQISDCEFALFDNYFEIVGPGGLPIALKDFWGDGGKTNWGKFGSEYLNKSSSSVFNDYRINIKVVENPSDLKKKITHKNSKNTEKNYMAGISFAFPKSIREEFNKSLVKSNSRDINKLSSINKYEIEKKCFKISADTVKNVLKYQKEILLSMNRNGNLQPNINYEMDVEDVEEYTDSEGNKNNINYYKKEIDEYKNGWAADTTGQLYKRDKKDGKFEQWRKYTDKEKKEDIESFKSNKDNCGHLCIFDNVAECTKFFEGMTKGREYEFSQLAELINRGDFVTNYEKLRTNIIKVNPVFVIGTLRAFKFEKWTKINTDGTKTVKVESFTHWWKNNGSKIMEASFKDTNGADTKLLNANKRLHEQNGLTPSPPENLELFLKLLVDYINNNEFILNPQNKEIINRLPITSIFPRSNGKTNNMKYFTYILNGNEVTVPNGSYKGLNNKENNESLENILSQMKKNTQNMWKPTNMGIPENKNILNSLLGLLIGVNGYGNLMVGRKPAFSTGIGYGQFGGSIDELENMIENNNYKEIQKILNEMKPCSRTALETFVNGIEFMKSKSKSFDKNDKYYNDMVKNIIDLKKTEDELYFQLELLSKYVKVLNNVDDKILNDKVIAKTMSDTIDEYQNSANKLSNKADSVISLLMRDLSLNNDKPTSYYNKL